MALVDFKLYMIGDRHQTGSRSLSQVVQAAAEAGVSAIQFREKDLPLRAQFDLAQKIKKATEKQGVRLLVNDRVDLCLALDAAGVHLPSKGLPIGLARRLLGKKKLIAVSCHSLEEVKKAEQAGADFAVLGPIYDTPSKRPYGAPLTLPYFSQVKSETEIPLFAIGGIGLEQLGDVFSAGADGVAMISGISAVEDVGRQCRRLLKEINRQSSVSSKTSI